MKETRLNQEKPLGASWRSKPQTRAGVIFAIALSVFEGHEACGSGAYLPGVGPPVLRFETATVPVTAAAAKIFSPEMVKANPVVTPVIVPLAIATNVISTAAISAGTASNPDDVYGPNILAPSAADDSVVTPQMLVDYLKPTAHGPFFVPINVGFTPPTPNVVQPSRAVYQSQ